MSWYVFNHIYVFILLTCHLKAPITEEGVFRACILAVYHLAGSSQYKMIFASPLWFGIGASFDWAPNLVLTYLPSACSPRLGGLP